MARRPDDLPPLEQLRRQLLELLPELRDALRNGWTLKSTLAAHGFGSRLLDQLVEVGALDYHLTKTGRWRRFTWTWDRPDAELADRVLAFPNYRYQLRREAARARYARAKHTRHCLRCRGTIERGAIYLQLRERGRKGPACMACAKPDDLPLHERELEALRAELERVVLLWPQELPIFADRLARVGRLTQAAATGPRGDLHALGSDLVEVGEWLKHADRKLQPRRELLLSSPPPPPDLELVETVGEHPLAQDEGEARAAAEVRLARHTLEQHRRAAADYLHEGLLHASGWLRDLFRRLDDRRTQLTA